MKIENFKIQKFDSLESTNKYCEALDLAQVEDFTCYWALEQTAGIGQRQLSPPGRGSAECRGGFNVWEAAPGKNLTFSLVLHPTFLPADRQFKLTEALSLALVDFLSPFSTPQSLCDSSPGTGEQRFHHPALPLEQGGEGVDIKWPNDIYVRMSNMTEGSERHPYRKICGTLVSTRLSGDTIASAVCGIGLNINQTKFPDWVPNPTSLRLLTGHHYELEPLLRQLLGCIESRYSELRSGRDPESEYLAHVLNLGSRARYIYNEEEITATINGVDSYGRLLLTVDDGRRISCGMKEISLL